MGHLTDLCPAQRVRGLKASHPGQKPSGGFEAGLRQTETALFNATSRSIPTVPHDTRDRIVDYIDYWKLRSEKGHEEVLQSVARVRRLVGRRR